MDAPMKSWTGPLGAVALMGLVFACPADEYYWTGAENALWTNAANWQVRNGEGGFTAAPNAPGQWTNTVTKTVGGNPKDVAVFGACPSGRTTIDLDGQWRIASVIVTNGAPAYTFGTGTDKAQYLMFDRTATFAVAAGVEADQTIRSICQTYDPAYLSNYTQYFLTLVNDAPSARLVYDRCTRFDGNGCPVVTLRGAGAFDVGMQTFDRLTSMELYQTGKMTLRDTSQNAAARVYTFRSKAAAALGGAAREIEVPAGCFVNTTGGYWGDRAITAEANTHVYGAGTLLARNHYNSQGVPKELGGNLAASAGKTLRVDCAIAPADGGNGAFTGSIGCWGTGTILLNGTNTCTGAVRFHEACTLAVPRIGAKGCAAEESCLGTGDEVRFYANGTLRYVGDGADATDRAFTTTNASVALTITFANGGGGTFTLNSHQKMCLPSAPGATLRLDAETASIVFGGTFEAGEAWTLQVAGWAGTAFKKEPGVPVTLTQGARLEVAPPWVVPADLSLTGAAAIQLAEGQALVLASLPTLPDGATLDFLAPEGASVTLPGHENLRFDAITLNGVATQTDEKGRLVAQTAAATAVWTATTSGGAWSSSANWRDGAQPAARDDVFVANGDTATNTYTIALDAPAQVNGIAMQEQEGGRVTLGGEAALSLGTGGYTLITNTTQTNTDRPTRANMVAGGPLDVKAPLRLLASQRWLLGSVRGWGHYGSGHAFTGDLSAAANVEWSVLGYGRYCFSGGSSANYFARTRVGIMFDFDGTNQFHRLGTNEIHLYRGAVDDAAARAAGTTETAPGLLYRFLPGEYAATVVNPLRVTGDTVVGGGQSSWSFDATPIAFRWGDTAAALTNRKTRLTLSGDLSCASMKNGFLQFSQSWYGFQPMTAYRAFDPDFGRIVLAGNGSGFATGGVRTYTTLEIAHAHALGVGNGRTVEVGSLGYWGQYYPYTVAGVLLRPGLVQAGAILSTLRSDANGAQNRPATMLVGSAETPAVPGATTATFTGEVKDGNEHGNELRFIAAAGTTAKFTGPVTVAAQRPKYLGTPDVVARGDVELTNPANAFGTNLCVRAGRLVLGANAAGRLPVVLGGFVPAVFAVRCADGASAAHGTVADVVRDGVTLYGKKMTFSAGPRVVDGVTVRPGDYVLNISPLWKNVQGIWKVVSDTEWQRPDELDEVADIIARHGMRVQVAEGATFGGTAHFLVTDPTHFRVSTQYYSARERLSDPFGAPIFHPEADAEPAVALLTGAAVTITNAVVVTDNHSSGDATIGGKTAEASAFSGPVSLARDVVLAAAAGGTVSFTGTFTGNGWVVGGGAGVVDLTAATLGTADGAGVRMRSGTLRVCAAQLAARPLGWTRTTAGDGEDWTEATGVLAVEGDLDLRGRALAFAGFEKEEAHVESRTLTLATCTGALTLPVAKEIAGSSGRWTLLADGTTLKARHALTGCVLIFR